MAGCALRLRPAAPVPAHSGGAARSTTTTTCRVLSVAVTVCPAAAGPARHRSPRRRHPAAAPPGRSGCSFRVPPPTRRRRRSPPLLRACPPGPAASLYRPRSPVPSWPHRLTAVVVAAAAAAVSLEPCHRRAVSSAACATAASAGPWRESAAQPLRRCRRRQPRQKRFWHCRRAGTQLRIWRQAAPRAPVGTAPRTEQQQQQQRKKRKKKSRSPPWHVPFGGWAPAAARLTKPQNLPAAQFCSPPPDRGRAPA